MAPVLFAPLSHHPTIDVPLRITDGALVAIDCVEGVCVQTETQMSSWPPKKIPYSATFRFIPRRGQLRSLLVCTVGHLL
ncbi:hypothetical protein CJ030_MR8G004023 [Morella rubra]|uniref:Uncharacterized protein n=1 Tax=Morella rubra TaxID=262757 RepID=A0A6A1UT83_9ROSI|nr:hypothetical protein CJ030_MR8G004023 [Morella rubra]